MSSTSTSWALDSQTKAAATTSTSTDGLNSIEFGTTESSQISLQAASGTDTAGSHLVITSGQGTGTGAGGNIVFQVADGAGSSGSSVNSLATALTIADNGAIEIGGTADGTDRSITFGHATIKTIMGIDDSSDAFVINTDNAFDNTLANNSFSIDASHNAIIAGDLTVVGNDIKYGAASAATLQVLASSGTDTVGGNLTISAGQGTGAGDGGDIIFQTADDSTSGSSANALATAMTIKGGGIAPQQVDFAANIGMITGGYINWAADVLLQHVSNEGVRLKTTTTDTNTANRAFELWHYTAGTPAAGIGTAIDFAVTTTAGKEIGMSLETITTDVSSGAEDFDFVLKLMEGGTAIAERFRVSSGGAVTFNRTSANNLADDGSIPITATCVNIDANGSARTGIRFGGTGTAGQMIIVNNTGGEALTFHNTEGTAKVRGINADHDTMEANFMGMFISDGSLWNLIAGGVDSQPDVGLTAS